MTVLPVRQQRDAHARRRRRSSSLNGNNIFSVASALQSASPSVIPMITIGDVDVGTAPGAARPANVGNADGIVGLFNSAASRAGGLLVERAGRDALQGALRRVRAAQPRGEPLDDEDRVPDGVERGAVPRYEPRRRSCRSRQADLDRYGIDGTTRANVRDIGRALIVAVKAFKMGLTNSVVLPAMRDDPHGAFADGGAMTRPADAQEGVRRLHDRPQEHRRRQHAARSLADDTVITIHGDTTKNPLNRGGWPDGTPNNTNVV